MSIMQGKRRHPVRHAPRFDEALTLEDFPGAPAGATVSEEGWLIVGQEAWTLDEWLHPLGRLPRTTEGGKYRNRYATDDERRAAIRRSNRESRRRRRIERGHW